MKAFEGLKDRIETVEEWTYKALDNGLKMTRDVAQVATQLKKSSKHLVLVNVSEALKEGAINLASTLQTTITQNQISDLTKGWVSDTKNQVLHWLNIPSQHEVDQINRKLKTLEKRLQNTKVKTKVKRAS